MVTKRQKEKVKKTLVLVSRSKHHDASSTTLFPVAPCSLGVQQRCRQAV